MRRWNDLYVIINESKIEKRKRPKRGIYIYKSGTWGRKKKKEKKSGEYVEVFVICMCIYYLGYIWRFEMEIRIFKRKMEESCSYESETQIFLI